MFGFETDVNEIKKEILNYINECVENYRNTNNRRYLYDLLEFCNWLLEVSDSIVRILKSYGIPITTKTEETIPKVGKPIFSAEVVAEPIVVKIPKIELKLPKEVETKTTVTTEKHTEEITETEYE